MRGSNVVRASAAGAGGARVVATGVFRLGKRGDALPSRLLSLSAQFAALLAELRPTEVAVEEAFFGKSVQSALRIGEARGVVLAVPSFEVLPFLARFAVIVAGAVGAGAPAAVLATVLAGSVLVCLLSAALLALAALLPVDEITTLLPPPLQAGLFSAIGFGLYLLSFDTMGLASPLAGGRSLLAWPAVRLWLPANLLGLGLWRTSRKTDSPCAPPPRRPCAHVHGLHLKMFL